MRATLARTVRDPPEIAACLVCSSQDAGLTVALAMALEVPTQLPRNVGGRGGAHHLQRDPVPAGFSQPSEGGNKKVNGIF